MTDKILLLGLFVLRVLLSCTGSLATPVQPHQDINASGSSPHDSQSHERSSPSAGFHDAKPTQSLPSHSDYWRWEQPGAPQYEFAQHLFDHQPYHSNNELAKYLEYLSSMDPMMSPGSRSELDRQMQHQQSLYSNNHSQRYHYDQDFHSLDLKGEHADDAHPEGTQHASQLSESGWEEEKPRYSSQAEFDTNMQANPHEDSHNVSPDRATGSQLNERRSSIMGSHVDPIKAATRKYVKTMQVLWDWEFRFNQKDRQKIIGTILSRWEADPKFKMPIAPKKSIYRLRRGLRFNDAKAILEGDRGKIESIAVASKPRRKGYWYKNREDQISRRNFNRLVRTARQALAENYGEEELERDRWGNSPHYSQLGKSPKVLCRKAIHQISDLQGEQNISDELVKFLKKHMLPEDRRLHSFHLDEKMTAYFELRKRYQSWLKERQDHATAAP